MGQSHTLMFMDIYIWMSHTIFLETEIDYGTWRKLIAVSYCRAGNHQDFFVKEHIDAAIGNFDTLSCLTYFMMP